MRSARSILLLLLGLITLVPVFQAKDEYEGETDVIKNVVGIDLGTTYSVSAIYKNGKVEIIANEQGHRITPSYVGFTSEGRLVGDSAKNQLEFNPKNTIHTVKRLMGRRFSDKTVKEDILHFPFEVIGKDGKILIRVTKDGKQVTFTPSEVSAMILGKMVSIVENYLGEKVTHAVVTVPAYFNDAQRKATKEAGTIAGITIMRIINEPTAAAIAYGIDKKSNKESNVLVYDLGGGTFDVSILTVDGGVFEVKATNGDTHLGGEDFDLNLAKHIVKNFKEKTGIDLTQNKVAFSKLKKKCEEAKRILSSSIRTTIQIENIVKGHDLKEAVTRVLFEQLNQRLFKNTLNPVKRVLADANMQKKDIDEVVLVGGSTRIPMVQKLLTQFFEGKKLHKDINPDEAIAYGAAVQGFILSGQSDEETKDMLLLDVTPLSLGIETVGGVLSKVIKKNTPIPTQKTQTFTTNENQQTTVTISVFEGEAKMTKYNHKLGTFNLEGIDKAMRGVPQIEVSFDIDANGILIVSAKDKSSGKNSDLKINHATDSGSADMEDMKKNFEKFAEEDEKIYNRTVAKNKLSQSLHAAEDYKTKEEKKLSAEDLEDLDKLISEVTNWNEAADVGKTEASAFEDKAKEVDEVVKEIQTGKSPDEEGEDEEEEEEEDDKKEEEKKEDDKKKKEGAKKSEL